MIEHDLSTVQYSDLALFRYERFVNRHSECRIWYRGHGVESRSTNQNYLF